MKTREELNELKNELESVAFKLKELNDDELSMVTGGVAGVDVCTARPGKGFAVYIRGIGTVNQSQPLVIIDGVAGGSSSDIAPQDIETIDILKDASATAIYGSKGSN